MIAHDAPAPCCYCTHSDAFACGAGTGCGQMPAPVVVGGGLQACCVCTCHAAQTLPLFVEALRRPPPLDAVASRYRSTLERIVRECGAVCEEFELCRHAPCASSAGAVLLALDALRVHESEVEVSPWRRRAPTRPEVEAHAKAHSVGTGRGLWMVRRERRWPVIVSLTGSSVAAFWESSTLAEYFGPTAEWRPLSAEGDVVAWPEGAA